MAAGLMPGGFPPAESRRNAREGKENFRRREGTVFKAADFVYNGCQTYL